MMSQIGSMGCYKDKEEEFDAYIARMKHYFKANDGITYNIFQSCLL